MRQYQFRVLDQRQRLYRIFFPEMSVILFRSCERKTGNGCRMNLIVSNAIVNTPNEFTNEEIRFYEIIHLSSRDLVFLSNRVVADHARTLTVNEIYQSTLVLWQQEDNVV